MADNFDFKIGVKGKKRVQKEKNSVFTLLTQAKEQSILFIEHRSMNYRRDFFGEKETGPYHPKERIY